MSLNTIGQSPNPIQPSVVEDSSVSEAKNDVFESTELLADITPPPKASRASFIVNHHGAPSIGAVKDDFLLEDIAETLVALRTKIQDAQLRTAKEGVQISKLKMEKQHQKSMDELQKSIKKSESAEAKSKLTKIGGWAAKIAAFVGSAAAVGGLLIASGFTLGAASPLLALAVIGLVGSSLSLISAIKQEVKGGSGIEINIGMTMACKAFLKVVGVPEDKLEAASRTMAGALGVATLVPLLMDTQLSGNLASGITELVTNDKDKAALAGAATTALTGIAVAAVMLIASGGTNASEAIKNITQNVPQLAKTVQMGAAVASGLSSASSGTTSALAAKDEHAASLAQVERKKSAAIISELQMQMEQNHDEIEKIVSEIQETFSMFSKILARASDNRSQIVANLSLPMA